MKLVIVTALIAVCGAAKLDRTYLPPASAKSAGGSPGSLQTPLQNSLGNNGLGGLPKGSFTNDFEGVVVDAAAAGIRASGNEETGLGAPRLSYGSTNSKVGAAAFKANNNAFNADGQTDITQRFQSEQGAHVQPGGSERPRAALDRAANTLRQDSEVGSEAYNYAFETDNGIAAEENGVATNGVQAQGGFSYTGDDGQVYSVSYTADEGGYQPKGDHLPTPPPIPEEILKSLEQNARDEAAGLVDDGSYDAQKYNDGSDYSESDNANGKYSHQSSGFGQADVTASGSFISQSNQPFRHNGQSAQGQLGHSQGQGHHSLGHGESPNGDSGFLQQSSEKEQPASTNNLFSSGSASGQIGFGNHQSQGLSNKFGQNSSGASGFLEQSSGKQQSGATNNLFGSGSASGQIGFGTHQSQGSSNRFGQSSPGASGFLEQSSGKQQYGATNNLFGSGSPSGQIGFGTHQSQGSFNRFGQSSPGASGSLEQSLGKQQSGATNNLFGSGSASGQTGFGTHQSQGSSNRFGQSSPGASGFLEQSSGKQQSGATNNLFGSGSASGQTGFGTHQSQGSSNRFAQSSPGASGFLEQSSEKQQSGTTNNRFGSGSVSGQIALGSVQSQGSSNSFGQSSPGVSGVLEQNSEKQQSGDASKRFDSGSASGQIALGTHQSQGSSNRFGQNSSGRFGATNANNQSELSGFASAQSQSHTFGSSAGAPSNQGFLNRNEYLPPTNVFNRPQNARPQSSGPQGQGISPDSRTQIEQNANTAEKGSGNSVALSQQKLQQQKRLQGTPSSSYNQPISSISEQSNLGSNSFSSQNRPSNTGGTSNRFGQGSQSSQASASYGDRNEYLPPTGSNQNRPFNRPSGSFNGGSQFNQQISQSADIPSSSQQDDLSDNSFTSASTSTAGSQTGSGSHQSNGHERPQATSNGRPGSSTGNGRIPSAQSSLAFNSQKATSVPITELTTPFESNADSSSALSGQTSSSENVAFGSRPSNGRPSQSQFGNQFYHGLTASPTQPSLSASSSFGSQHVARPNSFGQTQVPAFPIQASVGQSNLQSKFGQQSQSVQTGDAQYSPSTQRPSFAQQQQGPDDSYYYNQPSKPFTTPQSSRIPSAPSNQFNLVPQGSAFAQSSSQFNSPQNVPSTSLPSQSGNHQGSTRYPRPPTVAPTAFAPTTTQDQYQSSGFSGITQASVSPFPSQAPTQSSQFNIQSQFGSRPQTSNQFGQTSRKPSFGQSTAFAQSSFGAQSSPQRPGSRPTSFQGQTQTFEQQNLDHNRSENNDSPALATQQYNGEIYDYSKPTQTLPAPEKSETGTGQFGQKVQTQVDSQSRPQAGQHNRDSQSLTNAQFSQTSQSIKPQFGAQSSRPQFGQNNFPTQQQSIFGAKPQFGQPARTPFGQTASAQATFGLQSTNPQVQSGPTQSSTFGKPSRPSGQSQTDTQEETEKTEDAKSQFGFGSPCCQSSKPNSAPQPSQPSIGGQTIRPSFEPRPMLPSFGGSSQLGNNQFGSQSTSFTGSPSTSSTAASFAGKGEMFDASRKPPASSFNSETGYQY